MMQPQGKSMHADARRGTQITNHQDTKSTKRVFASPRRRLRIERAGLPALDPLEPVPLFGALLSGAEALRNRPPSTVAASGLGDNALLRGKSRFLVCLVSLWLGHLLMTTPSALAADWPQFMRDSAHTGNAEDEALKLPLGLVARFTSASPAAHGDAASPGDSNSRR